MPDISNEPDRPAAAAHKLHVLVVDDVAMNRDIATAFLRAAGHEVTCLAGGAEAVSAVADHDFDVVFMDVRMPAMDGLEATRQIRATAGPRGRVPIVALTAQASTHQVAECRKAGMNDHLLKPFDPDALHAVVMRAYLARPHHRDEAAIPVRPMLRTTPVTDKDPVVFNLRVFERTAIFLVPEMVAAHLKAVTDGAEALLAGLRAPDALIGLRGQLAEAAHALSGSAGMLGFERLTAVGRRFEYVTLAGSAEAQNVTRELRAALETTLQEIHSRISIAVEAGLDLARAARSGALADGDRARDDNPGGVFWMQMPPEGAATQRPDAPPPPVLTTAPAPARALRVLVVDDDAISRDIAGSLLRSSGNEATCVASGAQAIAAVAEADFDAVLMDVRMPGMDGSKRRGGSERSAAHGERCRSWH